MKPNQVWVTDITYIRTWQGWLYLTVVIDLLARNVVGGSMRPSLSRELALDALLMAVWRRKSAENVLCTVIVIMSVSVFIITLFAV